MTHQETFGIAAFRSRQQVMRFEAALRRAGLASALELRQLRSNEAQLALVRARLHLLAGRREDRLLFDLQGAVAESFGLTHRCAPDGRVLLRASERLMRRYYWAAKAVTQLAQILLQTIESHLRGQRGQTPPPARPTFRLPAGPAQTGGCPF